MNNSRDYTVNAVKKAICLLKCFDAQHSALTLSQLSELSGIDKSTTLRLLYTLSNEGFVDYNEVTRRYSLGVEIYRLGQLKYTSLDIREIVRKHLKPLCDEMSLISYFGIRQGDLLVMVDKIFPYNIPLWTELLAQPNTRELYSTGIGRLLLAQDTDEEVMAYLERIEIRSFTDRTIVDKNDILDLIRQARHDHYSGNLGENEAYVTSLCVPLYDGDGKVSAGISLCGPQDEIWNDRFDTTLQKLRSVAAAISRDWGYGGVYR